MLTPRVAVVALGLVLIAAACSGGGPSVPSSTAAPGTTTANEPGDSGLPNAASDEPAGGSSNAPAGGTVDPCELLTDEDVVDVTGWNATESGPGVSALTGGRACEWTLSEGSSMGIPATISVAVMSPGGRAFYDTYLAPFAEENGDEPIAGLGDVALRGSISGVVTAVRGDLLVNLQWIDFGNSDEEIPINLMERVLQNAATG